jgi:hypothetical protein
MLTSRSPIEYPEYLRDGDHLVQFYKDEKFLIETVVNYSAPALMNGEGVLIIASKIHLDMIEKSLRELPLNTSLLRITGQLIFLNVSEILPTIMTNDIPNAAKFVEVIGSLLYEMKSRFHSVKVYGELVQELWGQGNIYGTLALEKLWNSLLDKKEFTMLCTYSLDVVSEEKEGIAFSEVCQCHSHVIPAEGVIDVETPDQQMRKVAMLQFKQNSEAKIMREWKSELLEMKIPLTGLKMALTELQELQLNVSNHSLINKSEDHIKRLNRIIEQLSN